jgi:hypothetical protein
LIPIFACISEANLRFPAEIDTFLLTLTICKLKVFEPPETSWCNHLETGLGPSQRGPGWHLCLLSAGDAALAQLLIGKASGTQTSSSNSALKN